MGTPHRVPFAKAQRLLGGGGPWRWDTRAPTKVAPGLLILGTFTESKWEWIKANWKLTATLGNAQAWAKPTSQPTEGKMGQQEHIKN